MKKLIVTLALAFAIVGVARAEDLVFETNATRLVVRRDGMASLIDKQSRKQPMPPWSAPFAAVKSGGRLFPASSADRSGDVLHVGFGASGAEVEYRITAVQEYIVVELAAIRGNGIEEVRLVQLNVPLANVGGVLGMRWDERLAVCLMGLSAHVDSRIAGPVMTASVYPVFSMVGERVAIIAAPTPRFLDVVRKVERDFGLPSPVMGGKWAKASDDVRSSYLFTDLTEANADETVRYAKLGGFRYILVYSGTWSASLGSYPINTRNYPRGEDSLKAVIDKCHAAGLKVGLHMLTSFVGKNDPLVGPKPSPWLLKDAHAELLMDVNESTGELAARPLTGFPVGGSANDILIDNEIIHYGQINGNKFVQCVRGFAGTTRVPHKAGAMVHHLVEREGSYLADLKTPLKDAISDRVAQVINRCGFDMIYFDGGELNIANGPAWYWMGAQQAQILEKSNHAMLVQGSGFTSWTWHMYSRGTCDDGSWVAVKEYLDYHKIADVWRGYRNIFMPTDLGWWGLFQDAPDHPATTPDEVEYYAVRMMALDSAGSFETTLSVLKANGRTEEMLKLLGDYEQLRLSGSVPERVRQQLTAGEWHMTRPGEFHPIRYDAQRITVPGQVALNNDFEGQPLLFRLKVAPTLALSGDTANIRLLRAEPAAEVLPPDLKATMPGALIQHFEFAGAGQGQRRTFLVGPRGADDKTPGKPLNLTKHRALAVQLDVDGLEAGSGEPAVLNIQLQAGGGVYRDYYINLDFNGPRTIILAEPGTKRMLTEFRPAFSNYAFKAAMAGFNYGNVVAVNLRWMRYPRGTGLRCRIGLVEALEERDNTLGEVEISAGSSSITIPSGMKTGDYAEYWRNGMIRLFDRNGTSLSTYPVKSGPQLRAGANKLSIKTAGSGNVIFTTITLGK